MKYENRQVVSIKRNQKYENVGEFLFVDSYRITKVIKLLEQESKGGRLLDLGCCEGSMTVILRDAVLASETYGVDLIKERVEESAQKGIKAIQLDLDTIDKLPYADKYFDIIYCGELLEHLNNPDNLLSEIYRVLKLDGTAVLSTPNLAAWFERLSILFGFQPISYCTSFRYTLIKGIMPSNKLEIFSEPIVDHIRVMTTRTFKMMLLAHHFKIKHIMGGYGDAFLLPKPLKVFYKILGWIFNTPSLAANITVAVQKN